MKKIIALTAALSCTPALADSNWDFEITPYLWAVGQSGETGNALVTSDFDASFSDIFNNLDMAFLLDFEAQNDTWGIKADTVYMNVAAEGEMAFTSIGPGINAELDIKETVFSGTIFFKPVKALELHAGARYVDLDNTLNLEGRGPVGLANKTSLGDSWTEAIVGAKYTLAITEKLNLVGYGDIGGWSGKSDSMYQLSANLEYQMTDLLNIKAGYRVLDVDYDTRDFIFDAKTEGVVIGLGFNF